MFLDPRDTVEGNGLRKLTCFNWQFTSCLTITEMSVNLVKITKRSSFVKEKKERK